jgi:hypothetical protein
MRYAALLSLGLVAAPLCADWKVTAVNTNDHGRWIETEYYRNGVQRSDHFDPATGRLAGASVVDQRGMRQIAWDFEKREYSIRRLRRGQPIQESGPAIVIDVETTDTGERRTMFGREARRLITVERRHIEGSTLESELRTDGWYIDWESMPPQLRRSRVAVYMAGETHPPIQIHRHGVERTGLAVSTRRTVVSTLPSGERHTSEDNSEVTALFEGQLDATLFEPPLGFRRVFHYQDYFTVTWHDKMQFCWAWLQDRLGLP